MKKTLLLFLFTLICTASYSQENCKTFKTGSFHNVENGIIKATIQRNDSIQTEQHGEREIKLKIIWIEDCIYRLTFLEGNHAFWSARPIGEPTPDLIVRITNVSDNIYRQESRFEGDNEFKYRSEITKIK